MNMKEKIIKISQRRHYHIAKSVDNVILQMIINNEDINSTLFIIDRLGKKTIIEGMDIWQYVSMAFFRNMIKLKYIEIRTNLNINKNGYETDRK